MDFQTKVELPAGLPPVSHAERILLMGSCFAENMGRLLAENKFRVDMNSGFSIIRCRSLRLWWRY